MGNSALSSVDIIAGYDGGYTIPDDAALEPQINFEFEYDGYVDTDAGGGKNLTSKKGAFATAISDDTDIISATLNANGLQETNIAGGVAGSFYSNVWLAQTFTPAVSHFLNDITIRSGANVGAPTVANGTIMSIRHTLAGVPTGSDVAWATNYAWAGGAAWNAFTFTNPVYVVAGTEYAMVVRFPTGNVGACPTWQYTAAGAYAGGTYCASADSGAAWTSTPANDFDFNENGSTLSSSVEATGVASGEHVITTRGRGPNTASLITGDCLQFVTGVGSQINCGNIANGNEFWISAWFELDSDFAGGPDSYIFAKQWNDATDYLSLYLGGDGRLHWIHQVGGGALEFNIQSLETAWTANTPYHVIASLSNTVNQARLIVNGGAAQTAVDNTPLNNAGNFLIGERWQLTGDGITGIIRDVIVGNDDLLVAEEAALYAGTPPGDETEYWWIDEGTGTNIVSYGTVATAGTAGAGTSWTTNGRFRALNISIDSVFQDYARLDTAVLPNANDWLLAQNNVLPYMDYYTHTVVDTTSPYEIAHAWYQPNAIVENTSYDGTADAGSSYGLIRDAELTQANDYWNGALVTITGAGAAPPEGETAIVVDFIAATNDLILDIPFTAAVAAADTYTVEFGTLYDRYTYALDFDGTDDVVNCGANALLDIATTATIEAWIYPRSDGENSSGRIVDRWDGADGYAFYVVLESGGNVALYSYLACAVQDAEAISQRVVSTNAWHYVVAVYDRLGTGHWEIYSDGVLLTLTTDNAAGGAIVGHAANTFYIGDHFASVVCFDGLIDEVRFYQRAFDQAEVTANYNAGVGVYTPNSAVNLEGEWHIEDGSGVVATDTSGNGFNGAIAGALWTVGHVPFPGGHNSARITWGVNPTGTAVTVGGLVSDDQPAPWSASIDPALDVAPVTGGINMFAAPNAAGLAASPLHPLIEALSDFSAVPIGAGNEFNENQIWQFFGFALVIILIIAAFIAVPGHLFIACFAGAVGIAMCVAYHQIFPYWTLIVALFIFLAGLLLERSPSI